MFKGSCVALVTPMNASGEIDEKNLCNLVEWHIEKGTDAIVISGSTGESATLSLSEQLQTLRTVKKITKNRLPLIAGTGTNSTSTTISHTQAAVENGADACLVVTPYYNRPTQPGLIAHYRALDQAVNIPLILYNVPSRTGCDLLPETIADLSYAKNIIGIKEATGNLSRLTALVDQCSKEFLYYSGDDPTAFEFLNKGGHGVISITANVAPERMHRMCHAVLDKRYQEAERYEKQLAALHRMMIVEPNPIPVKWALHYMGKIKGHLRLPLTTLSEKYHHALIEALKTAESEILQ